MKPINVPEVFENNCNECHSLCCISHSLSADDFPISQDKPAGTACEYLTGSFKCRIHNVVYICAKYKCYGAGPIVTNFFINMENLKLDNKKLNIMEYHAKKKKL